MLNIFKKIFGGPATTIELKHSSGYCPPKSTGHLISAGVIDKSKQVNIVIKNTKFLYEEVNGKNSRTLLSILVSDFEKGEKFSFDDVMTCAEFSLPKSKIRNSMLLLKRKGYISNKGREWKLLI